MINENDYNYVNRNELPKYLGKEIILKTNLNDNFETISNSDIFNYYTIDLSEIDDNKNLLKFVYEGVEFTISIFKVNRMFVKKKVKIPLFPSYTKTQKLLKVLVGQSELVFKSMRNAIYELVGTPQKPVDWSDPNKWIPERLDGLEKEMAQQIWNKSNNEVNPRHVGGIYYLMNTYKLIEPVENIYSLTKRGVNFVSNEATIIKEIDEEEGLIYILYLCSVNRNSSRKAFLEDWAYFLKKNSNYKSESTIKDTLRRRLRNLAERGLVKKDTINYDITEKGEIYLSKNNDTILTVSKSEETNLNIDIEKFRGNQRTILYEELYKLSPYQFEFLIKDLLESMGYQDVEVTAQSNDKGVDVVGVIQNGITKVKEVIQVKRISSNVQRPVLDALRGSLHRFDAFQGTIITLSDFSKGTKEAAFERSAAPITLINGEKLIDLLIDNEIGIKKKQLEYFLVDDEYFKPTEEEID